MTSRFKKYIPARVKTMYFEMKHTIQQQRYKGNRYYCNCCDTSYALFLDMKQGSHPREKVVCPGCGAVERHRMMMRYLKENETHLFPKGTRILYIAPMLSIKKYLKQIPNTTYLGADLSSSFADVHFDLQDIPYPNDSFDFCICSHTLAHVKDDQLAMRELQRVLSFEGKLFIMERIHEIENTLDLQKELSDAERLQAYDQADRWRKYGQDFTHRVANCGFEVETIPYAAQLSPSILAQERMDESEVLFVATKREFL